MPFLKALNLVILPLVFLQSVHAQTFTDVTDLLHPTFPIEGRPYQRGASAADFNNDGLVDIYHPNFRDPGRLYLNRGDSGFVDILQDINLDEGTNLWGAAFGDYNNDGYLDIIFEDLSAPSFLYKNNRNRTFTRVNNAANLSVRSLAQGAAWGDFNLDGTLDVIVVNDDGSNQLFKNLDGERFVDVSSSANVATFGDSYGVSWSDINGDGYSDAMIAVCSPNILRSINHLLLNNGDETFTDIGQTAGVADSLPSWGPVFFDYDNDNDFDMIIGNGVNPGVTQREAFNRLYRNNGDNTFMNVSHSAGVAGDFDENSYGVSVADFDNDGWEDIYVTNLFRRDRLYRNSGDGTFTDIAEAAGIELNEHRAVAVADFNDDGWIDIFTAGSPENRLLFNDGGSNHWLRISARGTVSNYFGVGARVEVYTGALRQIREIRAGDSFCAQNHDLTAHFGLGSFTRVDSVIVRWPGGLVERIVDLEEVDRAITIVEDLGINQPPSTFALEKPANHDTLNPASNEIQFQWRNSIHPGPDPIRYRLQLSGHDLWTGATFDTSFTNIDNHFFVAPAGVIKPNHLYTWTVDVSDGFTVRASTDVWQFTVHPFGDLFTADTSSAVARESGVSFGGSWGDFDHDGDQDLFVANSAGQKNFLFENLGGGAFVPVTRGEIVNEESSSMGSTWGDFNQDGHLDLFVVNANGSNNSLFVNNGDGTFIRITDQIPVNDGGNSASASWVDYDNDSRLDLFVSNSSNQKNALYHQDANGSFTKITSGEIATDEDNSFGCAWADFDNDGDADLFVANVGSENNALYRNDGNGSFSKMTSGPVVSDKGNSRGGSWGDYDNDGDPDLFVTNFGNNFFYENTGDGSFAKITASPLVNDGSDSRGSLWCDVDNDGDLDLYVANAGNNLLYINNGDKTFGQFTTGEFVNDAGTSVGASSADFDGDGDPDVFVADLDEMGKNLLFKNNVQNNWIRIECTGTRSNTSAIGTKVRVRSVIGGTALWQMREISGQTGFAGQNSLNAAFGLGDAAVVDSIKIEWPSGIVQLLEAVPANQVLPVTEDSTAVAVVDKPDVSPRTFFLAQNYPNPFNPTTVIRYQIARPSHVELTIYNLLGERMRLLVDQEQGVGRYAIQWDGRDQAGQDVASGVYVYMLRVEGVEQSRKMLLIR